jgi:hypothetical protein
MRSQTGARKSLVKGLIGRRLTQNLILGLIGCLLDGDSALHGEQLAHREAQPGARGDRHQERAEPDDDQDGCNHAQRDGESVHGVQQLTRRRLDCRCRSPARLIAPLIPARSAAVDLFFEVFKVRSGHSGHKAHDSARVPDRMAADFGSLGLVTANYRHFEVPFGLNLVAAATRFWAKVSVKNVQIF